LQIIDEKDEIEKDEDEDKAAYEIWIENYSFRVSFKHNL
jgi:hypothetical protein